MAALKTLDDSIRTLALRNHSVFLKAALIVTHKQAASLLGISPATESEYCTEHAERFCQHLAAMGLRVVQKDEKTYPIRRVLAWKELARASFDDEEFETAPGALGD